MYILYKICIPNFDNDSSFLSVKLKMHKRHCTVRTLQTQTSTDTYGQAELDGVHRQVKRPGKVVLPQGLEHHLQQVLQLVGLPLGSVGVDVLRGERVGPGAAHVHLGWGLPLAAAAAAAAAPAAAARHLGGIQAVPHAGKVACGLGSRSGWRKLGWSRSRGRGRGRGRGEGGGVGGTPVQSWPRHRLH